MDRCKFREMLGAAGYFVEDDQVHRPANGVWAAYVQDRGLSIDLRYYGRAWVTEGKPWAAMVRGDDFSSARGRTPKAAVAAAIRLHAPPSVDRGRSRAVKTRRNPGGALTPALRAYYAAFPGGRADIEAIERAIQEDPQGVYAYFHARAAGWHHANERELYAITSAISDIAAERAGIDARSRLAGGYGWGRDTYRKMMRR